MPKRLRIALDHPRPETVTGVHLHSLVSSWLDDDHWASPKPYSIVPLHAGPDDQPVFEVGLLVDDLVDAVERGVEDLARRGGRLAEDRCRALGPPSVVAQRGWEEMWEEAATVRKVHVRFETPTAFRSGRLVNPLPIPASVFRSWAGRWRTHAPPALADAVWVNVAHEPVVVSELDGATVESPNPGRAVPGFVGTATYRNHRSGDDGVALSRRLHALAAVAEFAGTGASTTSGMGVTTIQGPS